MPAQKGDAALKAKVQKVLGPKVKIQHMEIVKKSIDARKKPSLFYVYTVDVACDNEDRVIKNSHGKVAEAKRKIYEIPECGEAFLSHRPIIVGSGPCGLFAALLLSEAGYRPIILERGKQVEERLRDTEAFFETGKLQANSNVQFGEGGAGTFSDGKLNTGVKDPSGRNRFVLERFVEFGAPKEILYEGKPHVGTDILSEILKNMRGYITRLGGEFHFSSQMTDLIVENGEVAGVMVTDTLNGSVTPLPAEIVLLAPGHSARDTFEMLNKRGVTMHAKAFAVGLRAEHLQEMIDTSQYGEGNTFMPAAAYKVAHTTKDGKGVYSFCMCPGGYVVNASSEEGHLAVNGMSYAARDGVNANSAIVVTVSPDEYGDGSPLSGVAFQRHLEKKAFDLAGGKIPVERFEDYKNRNPHPEEKADNLIRPQMKGAYAFRDVRSLLPESVGDRIADGMTLFGKKIHGFDHPDVLLSGIESRTSSPVRIERGKDFFSNLPGLLPCGEGAGYAGGITSAAIDGIKTAEAVIRKYRSLS